MKLITAIIKPFVLGDVREALSAVGVTGMAVTEVMGFGRQKGHTEVYRGAEYRIEFQPKLRVEAALRTDQLEPALAAIRFAANNGRIGDGKIFVSELRHAVRVRTGESGVEAL